MLNAEKFRSAQSIKTQVKPMFSLDQVCVDFGSFRALKNIQLTILPKEIWFLTGASGAGKTTLLNLLGGFIPASHGKVILPRDYYSKSFTSFVFQDLKLFNSQTTEENLWMSFDRKIYDNREEFHKEMVEIAQYLGAYDHLHHKIIDCNGGMKQKVAMMRALLSRPEVILADEPTSSLDRENSYKMFDLLNHYNQRRGLTIVWATHNKELIKQFSGKMAHLDAGKLVYSGNACFI